ncbi:MAG: arginine repressor [Fimbriimonadaceae bacterium]
MNESREARLVEIRRIITEKPIPNQAVLIDQLTKAGYEVTQSSVSRDLTDLNITKNQGKYILPDLELFQELGIRSASSAGPNLLVLKTDVGASPLIGVKLDKLNLPQIVGTISGDDTIFIATVNQKDQETIVKVLGIPS